MNSAEAPMAIAKPAKTSNSKKNTIAKINNENMKADRNMLVAIANFSCDRLAMVSPLE
jgi:hypothetical protein